MLKHDPNAAWLAPHVVYMTADSKGKAIVYTLMKYIWFIISAFALLAIVKKDVWTILVWAGVSVLGVVVVLVTVDLERMKEVVFFARNPLAKKGYKIDEILRDDVLSRQFEATCKYKDVGDMSVNVKGNDVVVSSEGALVIMMFVDNGMEGKIEDPFWLHKKQVMRNPFFDAAEIYNALLKEGYSYPKVFLCVSNGKKSVREYHFDSVEMICLEGIADMEESRKKVLPEIKAEERKYRYIRQGEIWYRLFGNDVYRKDDTCPFWHYVNTAFEHTDDEFVTHDEMKVYE